MLVRLASLNSVLLSQLAERFNLAVTLADEVRTLASRTQSSTQEIHAVLQQLQKQAKEASSMISDSAHRAQKSLIAEQSLQKITSDVMAISQRNELTASATEEQEQISTLVENFVSDIRAMAEGTSQSVQEVDKVAQNIHQVTQNLSELTGQFKAS